MVFIGIGVLYNTALHCTRSSKVDEKAHTTAEAYGWMGHYSYSNPRTGKAYLPKRRCLGQAAVIVVVIVVFGSSLSSLRSRIIMHEGSGMEYGLFGIGRDGMGWEWCFLSEFRISRGLCCIIIIIITILYYLYCTVLYIPFVWLVGSLSVLRLFASLLVTIFVCALEEEWKEEARKYMVYVCVCVGR
jgi:hypothetical protein